MSKILSDLMEASKQRIASRVSQPPSENPAPGPRLSGLPPKGPERWKKIALGLAVFSAVLLVLATAQLPSSFKSRSITERASALEAKLAGIESENRQLVEKIEAERESLKNSLTIANKESESLKFAVQKAELKLKAYEEEKVFLEDILIHKTKEIEEFRKGVGSASPGDAGGKLRVSEAEIQKLSERNKLLSRKLDDLYRVTSERLSAIASARASALEDTIADARKKIDEIWNTVDLGTLTVASGQTEAAPKETRKKSKTEGRILAINDEHGFVVVDLGKVDGVTSNTRFAVSRGKERIAVLTAMEVRDVMTACNILDVKKGAVLEVDDAITVQK
jgi:hypothetical protein